MHVIEIAHRRRHKPRSAPGNYIGHGVYSMTYQGELLGEARDPMCAAARILLAKGLAQPDDRIGTARGGVVGLSSTVRWAADHTVVENERDGPRWGKYRPFPALGGEQKTAFLGLPAIGSDEGAADVDH